MVNLLICIAFASFGVALFLASIKDENKVKDTRPSKCKECDDEYGSCWRCK